MNCSPISIRSWKYQELSRDYYVTQLPVGKDIKASSQTKSQSVRRRSALEA
ncbi:hypothetical protein AVEN_63432-1, partial [Araneus ventricosus]